MGFVATGDEFCRRGDAALDGVQQCAKVVDDILLWDEDYKTHIRRVYEVLVRCRTHGITINAEKFVLAAPDVTFCGFKLSREGIAADEEKTDASRLYGVGYALLQDHGDEWRRVSLAIPDALSRAPVDKPSPEDVALGKEAYAHVRVVVAIRAATLDARSPTGDLVLDGIRTAAREDVIYTRLLECVTRGFPSTHDSLDPALRPYWKERHNLYHNAPQPLPGAPQPLTTMRGPLGPRIVVPSTLRPQKIPDPATPNVRRRRRREADGPIRRSARIALRS
ncbi:hypothetical protein O3P69_011237 [Scylla paramamosain]|uniref:Reverse transcriptase domain-containing protein n=1 Tax=Scylla paramamosain TaxID=85552 RepID=A0AAW0SWS0_SCYPA